ncbi:cell surface protein SprA [Mangrovibacterium diazotrophicum]|uniref:Cell surface protein SprA n=2 Tax=Mangrovibacterium diazotrophicum TaxID=1261403 RepID=A0A419W8Z6_9BACT|nr:cell surface protein SprA [Mangrovibacterium diazotrophicum]
MVLAGVLAIASTFVATGRSAGKPDFPFAPMDSVNQVSAGLDTTGVLVYPFEDEQAFEYADSSQQSAIYLKKPSNIRTEVEYDPVTGQYILTEKVGDFDYRLPKVLSLQEYIRYDMQNSIRNYWRTKSAEQETTGQGGLFPSLTVNGEAFNKIFGGNNIDIRTQGFVEVSFGYQVNTVDNPSLSERQRKVPTFDFDQKIQMNLTGSIGDKMKMQVNYNTEATFDYENKMKLDYSGDEDEIIKKIEAGNVSLPLNGSLIKGATNLFGVRTDMQFGKLSVSTVLSQSKGETKTIQVEGGAQTTTFEIDASDYDANKHFFLSQYFRDTYDNALKNMPVVNSAITINKIEVWVTNKSGSYTSARNILALMDLGEHDDNIYNSVPSFQEQAGHTYPESVYPYNDANQMYSSITEDYSDIRTVSSITKTMSAFSSYGFKSGKDYEKVQQARQLSSSEYTINTNLGYISLNSALNSDEVLAVAYNYTANGKTYQVGEFASEVTSPGVLVVKLLKGTSFTPTLPTWDLMMKNVYSLDAYDLNSDDFVMNVTVLSDSTGSYVNYLPSSNLAGKTLLSVLNLDNLDANLDKGSNGAFDFVDGITVQAEKGRIIFPCLEPFGSYLTNQMNSSIYKEKYGYQSLYDTTKTYAKQDAEHDKYKLKGTYSGSSSSEISLGTINLAQGSVTVTSGGVTLTEYVDYTVDYTLGRVKIINPTYLDSGSSLQISVESQDLYSVQTKTLLGTHMNYAFSDNFNLGATALYLNETPISQKVNYGSEPVSNTMLGLDLNYTTESQFLTNLVDKLPFLETKEKSSIAVQAEVAKLIVGESSATDGTVYIDDFEASETDIDLSARQAWVLASTPQGQSDLFPEGDLYDDLAYGYNRARFAWYNIDPLFLRNTTLTPSHIKQDTEQQSDNLVREVYVQEIYPDKELDAGETSILSVLNMAFYPNERGPYNFDLNSSSYSSGLNPDGTLAEPTTRWGGIMREITTTDFESANIEYISFWMMDPFVNNDDGTDTGGDLYFNLGDISEDVLKDSYKSFENGLPESALITDVDTTVWGRVSTQNQLTTAFVSDDETILNQDVGFDGLSDADEMTFHDQYLQSVQNITSQSAYEEIATDPSADDYHYFRGSDYDQNELSILDRYKKYNGPEGNSVPASYSPESYSTSASTTPNCEDINDDNTLSETENYFQYHVSLRPEDMVVGQNNISDVRTASVELANGQVSDVKWYQFKIPIDSPDEVVGDIGDFSSIRFIRMFMRGFEQPTFLRLATLDLVRAEWRQYSDNLEDNSANLGASTSFEVSAVNIEENSQKEPVNYILPPDIEREVDYSSSYLVQEDEQSLLLKVEDLEQGDSRAAYKNINLDFRPYKRLKLEVHAEAIEGSDLDDDDLYFFMRLGSDYNDNYYEYELPLKLTPAGSYNGNLESDRYIVWPDENRINIPFTLFTNTKLARNADMRESGSTLSLTDVYEVAHDDWNDGKNLVKIKGSPNLGNVQVMMLGIRHKSSTLQTTDKSVEVWTDELRLTGLEDNGGWAANVRTTAKLADFGTVTFAGSHTSAGFGSIDESVSERSDEDVSTYDITGNFDMGKFFPSKAQVKIPVFLNLSKSVSNPYYNPLDPDVTMSETLANASSKSEKDSLKNLMQTYSKSSSIIFNNVKVDKKIRKDNKTSLIDPANFSVSFSYNKQLDRDVYTEYDIEKSYRLILSYVYNNRPKVYEPFKKVNLLKGNAFRLIRDFNFSLMPTQISYINNLYRYYNETQTRNVTDPDVEVPVTVNKDFLWKRSFNLRYNLTKSLIVSFSSEGTARIDEPEGVINKSDDDYQLKKDSILSNLLNLGRPILYNHVLNVTYQLPLNKIDLLNWTNATARYQAGYDWTAGSVTDETVELGNVIENTRVMQGNAQLNFNTLYNKVPFLKSVNQRFGTGTSSARSSSARAKAAESRQTQMPDVRIREVSYKDKKVPVEANQETVIHHHLKTKDVQVKVFDEEGLQVRVTTKVLNENEVSIQSRKPIDKAQVEINGKRKIENNWLYNAAQYSARTAMMLKSFSAVYSSSDGTVLPGFMPEPSVFGSAHYDPDPSMFGEIASTNAPGLPFLFGWQDEDFARKAALKGWITKDTTLNSPYIMSHNEAWSFQASLVPIPNLNVNLSGSRSASENSSEYYLYDVENDVFNPSNRTVSGNFTMSINTWRTAFEKIGDASVETPEAYQNMLDYRETIARRLAARRVANAEAGYNPEDNNPETEFPWGYGPTSQEVLIPAFIAAYTGQSPDKVSLNPLPSLKYLRPNWRITYDGLVSKIKGLNRVAKSISLSHSYRSTYNIGSYSTNLDYDDTEFGDGWSYVMNSSTGDFVSQYDISSVSITEQLNPLINLDVTWLNDLSTSIEINRTRNLTVSFSTDQLTEVQSREISVGLGYRFPRMDLILKSKSGQKAYSNDLNIKIDMSFKKNKTVLRDIAEEDDQLSAGQNAVTLKTSADYQLSDRFQLKLYYDKVINNPFTSSSYPSSTTSFGMSFRFTLAQ